MRSIEDNGGIQKLGEKSPKNEKEGHDSLEEFRRAWMEIKETWEPRQTVIVHEFKLVKTAISRQFWGDGEFCSPLR